MFTFYVCIPCAWACPRSVHRKTPAPPSFPTRQSQCRRRRLEFAVEPDFYKQLFDVVLVGDALRKRKTLDRPQSFVPVVPRASSPRAVAADAVTQPSRLVVAGLAGLACPLPNPAWACTCFATARTRPRLRCLNTRTPAWTGCRVVQ